MSVTDISNRNACEAAECKGCCWMKIVVCKERLAATFVLSHFDSSIFHLAVLDVLHFLLTSVCRRRRCKRVCSRRRSASDVRHLITL